ncbi:PREDICTED: phosphoglycerate mutase 2 isoform X2 [Drosophila arizonae]|uniref:Phosphoglycerate mutase n=1 Tax=Drosophila arizonae TaxID=7263 RepID=A0ABM1P3Y8_DROAR|nr:PREDICTED: phosphoglycerate mutase 2 isoform X2 [Drosophila arizonae]
MRELCELLQCQANNLMSRTNQLVLVRHGESEFNLKNLFCGWHDAPLSAGGLEEARILAAANLNEANMVFDKVYCSKLCRSRTTVEAILSEMQCSFLPIVSDWRLNERHYGNLTGVNKRVLANQYGEEQVQFWRRNYDGLPPPINESNIYYYQIANNPAFLDVPPNEFPLTESMRMCVDRVAPIWLEIKKEVLMGARILLVVHGTVARALIKHIEGFSEEQIEKVNIPNSVPIVYEFNMKSGQLVGDVKYLGDSQYIEKMKKKVAAIGD